MDTSRAESASTGYVLMRHSEICPLPLLSRSRQPVSQSASMEPRSQYGATGVDGIQIFDGAFGQGHRRLAPYMSLMGGGEEQRV